MRCGAVEDTRRWSWILKSEDFADGWFRIGIPLVECRRYPPFNDNSDLCIVLPGSVTRRMAGSFDRASNRIRPPTIIQPKHLRVPARTYVRSAKILSLDGTVYVRDLVEQEGT
ncbi:unnamed protein product [Lasius platythorax]|uniref:Uncharacterized protein n=1 Tax=Lasius platythorax TaxID=488582 RepID=A0AAV2N786_9HYME